MPASIVVHFDDCARAVDAFIERAQRQLAIAICWFTHPGLFERLLERQRQGVAITLALNFDQINFHPEALPFGLIEQLGGRVYAFAGPELLHHKFALADGSRVLQGSYNWTRSRHCDYLTEIVDGAIAAEFEQALAQLLPRCLPLAQVASRPVRQVSFMQLHQPGCWSADDMRRLIVQGSRVWVVRFPARAAVSWAQCFREQRHYAPGRANLSGYWAISRGWEEASFREWLSRQPPNAALRLAARYCLRLRTTDVLLAVDAAGRPLGMGVADAGPEPAPNLAPCSRQVWWLRWPPGTPLPMPLGAGAALHRYKGSGLQLVEHFRRGLGGRRAGGDSPPA